MACALSDSAAVSGLRLVAELLQPVEVETPYGGRSTTYDTLGVVWLSPGPTRRRERSEVEVTRRVEAMTVTARTDPRLVEGRILRFGGGDWAIITAQVEAGRSGRTSLVLERGR